MTDLVIPRFLDLGAPEPDNDHRRQKLDARLVAAIRYDYEIGLMSMAQVVHKYRYVVGGTAARQIMNRTTYPDVKPVHHHLAWCAKWRRQ